jgi:hypothetical protein
MPIKEPSETISFASGAVPGLEVRKDVQKYYDGALRMENVETGATGEFYRRGGLLFTGNTLAANEIEDVDGIGGVSVILAEFVFSRTDKYLWIFKPLEVEIYYQDELQTTLETPWGATHLPDLRYVQAGVTMVIMHEDVEWQRIVRGETHDDWSISEIPVKTPPTFQFEEDTAGTLTVPGTSGDQTFTSSEDDFANVPADPDGLGWMIFANDGRARIKAKNSDTSVDVEILESLGSDDNPKAGDWSIEEPVFSDERGWPRCMELHEGRQAVGGTRDLPGHSFAGKTGSFFDFTSTVEGFPDDATDTQVPSRQRAEILDMLSSDGLVIFSTTGVSAVDLTPLDANNYVATMQSDIPVANVRPVVFDDEPVYVAADDKGNPLSVFELVPDDRREVGRDAADLGLLAHTLIRRPVDMDVRKGIGKTTVQHLFVVNEDDGTMPVLQSRRKQNVAGWTLWNTKGEFLRVAVVAGDVYVLVRRTLDGSTVYALEKLDPDAWWDCSLTVTAEEPTDLFEGFDHLANEVVRVRLDGSDYGKFTVGADGAIDVSAHGTFTTCEAGLEVSWEVETMPIASQLSNGTPVGATTRIVWAAVKVKDALELTLSAHGMDIPLHFRKFGSGAFGALQPYTGVKKEQFLNWESEAPPTLTMKGTLPITIQSVTLWVAG